MIQGGVFKTIPPYDVIRTRFNTHKSWNFTQNNFLNSGSSEHSTFLVAHKPNPSNYVGGIPTIGTIQVQNDPINTSNSFNEVSEEYYATSIWYSLNHLYYKNPYSYNSFGIISPGLITKFLYETGSVISIPQPIYGNNIKYESLNITVSSSNISMSLKDDGNGNLIDTKLSASIVPNYYLGFNTLRFESGIDDLICNNVDFISADIFDGQYGESVGLAAKFTGDSYIQIPNTKPINPTDGSDFCISFWVFVDDITPTTTEPYNWIISKRREAQVPVLQNGLPIIVEKDINATVFPYEIRLVNSTASLSAPYTTTLQALCSDGDTETVLSTVISVGDDPYGNVYKFGKTRNATHIVFQRIQDTVQLYKDGILIQESECGCKLTFNNNCDLFLGNFGKNHGGFAGTIDEFNYFNYSLSPSQIIQLSEITDSCNAINTNVIGNVFYEHGLITISDVRPKYTTFAYSGSSWNNLGPAAMNMNIQFKGSHEIEEVEVLCRIREDEFTFTNNPTVYENAGGKCDPYTQQAIDNINNEYWTPWITTIGLYNDNYELIAVGKLANPISKRMDVDMNFIIRFDI